MIIKLSILVVLSTGLLAITTTTCITKKSQADRKLVWADEFNSNGLPDSLNWSYDVGDACDLPAGCGWGNNELQYYTAKKLKNARIEAGHLIIEAHREQMKNSEYTSARLVSKNKGNFKYGKIEIKAKLPTGLGTWPAIWMLPTHNKYGNWPRSGEIDIMEHVGYEKDTIYGTPHTMSFNGMIGTQKIGSIYVADAEEAFHTYAIEWTPNSIQWFLDGYNYHTFNRIDNNPDKWPFDQEFHLILNIGVGGNWGGKHGVDSSIWPQKFLIDYIRVYEQK